MRTMGRYMLVLAAGSLLAACSSSDKKMVVTPTEVEGKTWVLSSLDGQPPVDGKRVTLEFQSASDKDGKVSGRGPCNGYFGSYTMQEDELQFGRVGSTMMACPEPVMKQEMAFFSAFQQVDTMTSNGEMLVLKSRHSKEQMTFVSESAEVKGVVKSATGYFPADSDVRIQLRDISKQDARSNLIGEKKVKLKYELDAPLNFEIPYSPTLVMPNHTYSVSVEVRHKGKLISRSTSSNIVDLAKPLDMKTGQ
ncbi:META domain-containing protein [Endozoicomonas arenosclerae]|uniref:META domain-containing protein n=1 Tax=Endozoicomonas arenosclerae TaxID=1633495 RepID=UPI0009A18159|nr:META domain-containing protein [Endozoicomonas arenosclerae]